MKIPVSGMGEKPANQSAASALDYTEVMETNEELDEDQIHGLDMDMEVEVTDDVFEIPKPTLQSHTLTDNQSSTVQDPELSILDKDESSEQKPIPPPRKDSYMEQKPIPPPRKDSCMQRHLVDKISTYVEEPEEEHQYWDRQFMYLLACVAFVSGLGTVLKFPGLAVRHGGGAFFVAYMVMMLLCGCPMVYLETTLGQYSTGGPITAWKVVLLFRGLGTCMLVVSVFLSLYYVMEVVWAVVYLSLSIFGCFQGKMPWINYTTSALSGDENMDNLPQVYNRSGTEGLATSNVNSTNFEHSSLDTPAHHYFYTEILHLSHGLEDIGLPQWYLVLSLLLVWIIIFCCLFHGAKSLGKVVCVTAILPYLILPLLFVFSCLSPGSLDGIKYFLNPQWRMLGNLQIWVDAATLMVYSLGLGTGCLSTLASYTHFHSHCFRNLLLICFANMLGLMVSGFSMYAVLGVYANITQTSVQSLKFTEYELGFAIFPYIISKISPFPGFSVLFFMVLILLGIDGELVLVQNIVASMVDILKDRGIKVTKQRRIVGLLSVCITLFAIGMVLTTEGGLYVTEFLNSYVCGVSVLVILLLECLVLMYLYGATKFTNNIADMTGNHDSPWWKWSWRFFTPTILLCLIIISCLSTRRLTYREYDYPEWTEALGWILTGLPLTLIPIEMLFAIQEETGPYIMRMKNLLRTPRFWGSGISFSHEHSTVPEYVICHPDNHRPAHGLAMLTANLYIPDIANLAAMEKQQEVAEMTGGYMSDLMTVSSTDSEDEDEENGDRGNWRRKVEFILSCLGYVVGLGNIWRFPFLVYRNGGGAFFVAYLVMLLLCGIPLVYMEMAFGQFGSLGPITIWKAVPLFRGIGYCMVISTAMVSYYYNMINSWALHFLFSSFYTTLPWTTCDNQWNTDRCQVNKYHISNCSWINTTYLHHPDFLNHSCYEVLEGCTSPGNNTQMYELTNVSECIHALIEMFGEDSYIKETLPTLRSPSEEYFYMYVLKRSESITALGPVDWQLALYFLLCWGTVFICLVRGIYSAGKVAYFVVIVPFVILIILLIFAMMVDGHLEGIKFFVTPDWNRLWSPGMWSDAASQVFFSLSVMSGGLTTLASYNKFHNNICRDAILICLIDTLMSTLAGFTVFATIGILAHELNTKVENVIESATALVFIVFPAAIQHFNPPQLWSGLFFIMILLMGMSSQLMMVETVVTAIIDEKVQILRKWRLLVLLCVCCIFYLLGLPQTTQAGIYILQLVDECAATIPLIVNGIFMCLALAWIYKIRHFCSDIQHMTGFPVSSWWKVVWSFVTPIIIILLLVLRAVGFKSLSTMEPEHFPHWIDALGIFLCLLPLSPIPICAIIKIIQNDGTFLQRVKKACESEPSWGPAHVKHWKNVEYYPAVNTHTLAVDIEHSPLHTVTDRIDFATSRVDVPHLSQTNLLPKTLQMSPKKPQSMRQKAILNYAYSNPQCNHSTASIDKLHHRAGESRSHIDHNVLIVTRKNHKVETRDVATQTGFSSTSRITRAHVIKSTSSAGASPISPENGMLTGLEERKSSSARELRTISAEDSVLLHPFTCDTASSDREPLRSFNKDIKTTSETGHSRSSIKRRSRLPSTEVRWLDSTVEKPRSPRSPISKVKRSCSSSGDRRARSSPRENRTRAKFLRSSSTEERSKTDGSQVQRSVSAEETNTITETKLHVIDLNRFHSPAVLNVEITQF